MTSLLVYDDNPTMIFCCIMASDGTVESIVPDGPWHPEMLFSSKVLEYADLRFVAHGDGLITIYTRDEIATYGVIGEETSIWGEPVQRARLLHVHPAVQEHDAPAEADGATG